MLTITTDATTYCSALRLLADAWALGDHRELQIIRKAIHSLANVDSQR